MTNHDQHVSRWTRIVRETTPEEWRSSGYPSKKQRFEGKGCQGPRKAKRSLELITMPTAEKVPKMHTKTSMGGRQGKHLVALKSLRPNTVFMMLY